MSSVTVGGDPEFFIVNAEGKAVPAHTLGFPNVKTDKVKTSHGAYGRDGYVIEVNMHPETCRAYTNEYTKSVLRDIKLKLPAGYSLKAISAMPIEKSDLKDAPDDVQHFGCDPSMDGYSGEPKYSTVDAMATFVRFAGGHFHWGTYLPHEVKDYYGKMIMVNEDAPKVLTDPTFHPRLARLMDEYVGIPQAVVFKGAEQYIRRTYYGQAGEYRTQDYGPERDGSQYHAVGFEYRTPPSEVWQHQAMVTLFLGVGRWVIRNFDALAEKEDKGKWDDIRAAINKGENPEQFLKSVPGFYHPETILALRDLREVHEFNMFTGPSPEAHTSWSEMAVQWNLPRAGEVIRGYA